MIAEPLDIDTRISLRWDEGRWTAQTDCQITSQHCPDFVDIAIPTRWCDSLTIEPLRVSSRQPTLDPSLQVMRIDLKPSSPDEEQVRKFRLVGRLAVSEISRVSVPEIRVLDARRHRIDVVVPTRLINEQVRWRSNFAGPIEEPRWRIEDFAWSPESPSRNAGDVALSVYAVTGLGWSIDLETLPRTDRRARLFHTDHRFLVRPQSETAVVVSRFDLVPGDQQSVSLLVSDTAKLRGVWAAGRPADLQPREAISDGLQRWDVSLPLSRLTQSVEVLTEIELPDRDQILGVNDLPLPDLVGLNLTQARSTVNWCEVPSQYSDGSLGQESSLGRESTLGKKRKNNESGGWIPSPVSPETRYQILASSVVRAIAASSDALAERRDEEVASWMRPWIARYRMLSRAVGRLPGDQASPSDAGATAFADQISQTGNPLLTGDSLFEWDEMDGYVLDQETRYFPGKVEAFGTTKDDTREFIEGNTDLEATWSDFLSVNLPPGFTDRWTFLWTEPTIPVARLAAKHRPLAESSRQQILRVSLFLAIAGFVFVSVMFPNRDSRHSDESRSGHSSASKLSNASERTLELEMEESHPRNLVSAFVISLQHPASWLVILGLIGLVLMPTPMALGLMLAGFVLGGFRVVATYLRVWRPFQAQ